jgi:hydrogenase expression/formation protein HypC
MEFLEPPRVGSPVSERTSGTAPAVSAHCTDDVCITCSDAAVAVTVLEVRAGELALVDTGAGPPEEVSIALVDAGVGDVVLVHAGEAIAVVTPGDGAPGVGEVGP